MTSTREYLCYVAATATLLAPGAATSQALVPSPESARPKQPGEPGWEWLTLDGSFRTRGALLVNLDLDRGPTPSTGRELFPLPISGGETLTSADARLRLDAGIHVGDVVQAHVRVDALDGLLLGATPDGFPSSRWAALPWASLRQLPASDGRNALLDSIRLEHAWGSVQTPVGVLAFGRMPLPAWGLGMVSGPPEDLDHDFDDAVDRVAFATSVKDHAIGVAFDVNAVGPSSGRADGGLVPGQAVDLEPRDNVQTVSLALGRFHDDAARRRRRAAKKPTVSYGAWGSFRWQHADLPAYHLGGFDSLSADWDEEDAVPRRLRALMLDGWIRLDAGPARAEIEGAYGQLRVGDPSTQAGVSLPSLRGDSWGLLAQLELEALRERIFAGIELGLASGDPAPGIGVAPPAGQASAEPGDLDGPQFSIDDDLRVDNFRFHPNRSPDVIFWRRIVGAVSDAAYLRPGLRIHVGETLVARLQGVFSWAMRAGSTPSGAPYWGSEVDLSADWTPVPGFFARGEYGLFLPGRGLDNRELAARARPAHAFRALLAVRW